MTKFMKKQNLFLNLNNKKKSFIKNQIYYPNKQAQIVHKGNKTLKSYHNKQIIQKENKILKTQKRIKTKMINMKKYQNSNKHNQTCQSNKIFN